MDGNRKSLRFLTCSDHLKDCLLKKKQVTTYGCTIQNNIVCTIKYGLGVLYVKYLPSNRRL